MGNTILQKVIKKILDWSLEEPYYFKKKVLRFGIFSNQILIPEMFVPWKDGRVLEKPVFPTGERRAYDGLAELFDYQLEEYKKTSDRVILKTVEIKYHSCKDFKYQSEKIIFVLNDDYHIEYNCYWKTFKLFSYGEYHSNVILMSDLCNLVELTDAKHRKLES